MFTVFWRLLKDRKNTIIMFSVFGTAMLWLYILMFPSMEKFGQDLMAYMEALPPTFSDLFPVSEATFASIENFLAMEHYSLMVPLFIIFMVVAMAAASLASEVESGTAEIVLAQPISRLKIFFSRYLVGITSLIIFITASTLMIIPLAGLHNVEYSLTNFISISILCLVFGWAIYSIAMLASAIFSERSKVYMFMGGMMVGMYILQIVASINEKWDYVQYFSFFYYYDYNKAILENSIDPINILLFSAVIIICTIVGAYWFNKRDIAIQ
ncbi:MAG: ABC transporter permease subunit [bacterium]|nr:ABC transporter permease subunit [bacterium]